jgi:quinol-cytochrome oxidoreductase complex cytochrome b subunit
VHIRVLHDSSSSSELRMRSDMHTRAEFERYFVMKDLLTLIYAFAALGAVVLYIPEVFNHSVNYIAANILVTPSHIVPE